MPTYFAMSQKSSNFATSNDKNTFIMLEKEERIIVLPKILDRQVANSLNNKEFPSYEDLENAIRKGHKDTKCPYHIEDILDEMGVYSLDEFICLLNDEIYPSDMYVARVSVY